MKSRLKPCRTRVTRSWFDDLMSLGWVIGEYSNSYEQTKKAESMLREKGILVIGSRAGEKK